MSLSYILGQYDAIGVYVPRMSITLDQTFTGSAELTAMFRAAFGQDSVTLSCTKWDRSEDGSSLRLDGSATLLGLTDAQVEFAALDIADDMRVELSILLPSGWKFATSFPDIPATYDEVSVLGDDDERTEEERWTPILDGLSLGTSRLVFTNRAHTSDAYGADLLPGLNFVGELYFLGDLIGIRTLTGQEGPVQLAGPVLEYRENPDPLDFLGLRLTAPVPLPAADWPVPLTDARLLVKTPVVDGQVDHTVGVMREPGIYLGAHSEVAGRPVRLVARYEGGDDPTGLTFYALFDDFSLSGFSDLAQAVGGDDVQGALPEQARPAGGIRLTEIGMSRPL